MTADTTTAWTGGIYSTDAAARETNGSQEVKNPI
jgi:hypothetical protein